MVASERFSQALARGPIVLDGAMGTRLIERGLDLEYDRPCLWNITRPSDVREVHRRDIAAGADAILTNTFGADRGHLERFGRRTPGAADVEAINRRGVELAREAAGPSGLVLGSLAPGSAMNLLAVAEQTRFLIESHVDAIVLETHTAAEAIAALTEWPARSTPVVVSLCDRAGAPTAEQARRLAELGACVLGFNCVHNLDRLVELLAGVRRAVEIPLWAKPSAGLPGSAATPPEAFAAIVPTLLELGACLIGGCCGATEEHVAAVRRAVGPPR